VVRTGRNMREGNTFSVVRAKRFFHPDFDVALVKLQKKITSASVVSVPLRAEEPPSAQTQFTAVGWGLLRPTDTRGADDLQQLDGLEVATCLRRAHICGRFPGNGARTAKGDSGGPAVYEYLGHQESFGVLSGIEPTTMDRVDYVRSDMFYLWAIRIMQAN
jgi:hypothetical protein